MVSCLNEPRTALRGGGEVSCGVVQYFSLASRTAKRTKEGGMSQSPKYNAS